MSDVPARGSGRRSGRASGRGARRRWPRVLAGLVVVLLVLAGGAALAARPLDAALRGAAEQRVAQQLQRETGATGEVAVTVGGGWFLPQVLRGRYPQVRVDARGVPAQGLRLERVDADLRDVTAPLRSVLDGAPQVSAASSRAQVLVAYPVLNELLGQQQPPLRVAPEPGSGQLRVTGSAQVLGREVALSGLADLEVEDGGLRAVPTGLDVDGGVLDALSRTVLGGLREELAFTVPLGELPYRQRVSGVEVASTGVVLSAEGSDVVLAP